jgi:hypothetical protein
MEKPAASLPVENGLVTVRTGPFEIKTVRIRFVSQHTAGSEKVQR